MLSLAELATQIRARRKLLHLSQQTLAAHAGVSQSLIAKMEAGSTQASYESVRRIVTALEALEHGDELTAGQLMHDPVMIRADAPISEALGEMKLGGFSQLPVHDAGRPMGCVTERSLLNLLHAGTPMEELRALRACDAMGPSLPTVDEHCRHTLLQELLQVHEAVLVTRAGNVVGVVGRSDLFE